MSNRHRRQPIPDELKEIMMTSFRTRYDNEEEALEAFNNHMDESKDALKVYFHGYLEESEFSKEDFKMLPKPILNLISWMVTEIDEMNTFKDNVEHWIEERPF